MLGPLRVWFPLISNLDTCRGHVYEEDWASEQALEPDDVGPGESGRLGVRWGPLRKAVVVVNLIIDLT